MGNGNFFRKTLAISGGMWYNVQAFECPPTPIGEVMMQTLLPFLTQQHHILTEDGPLVRPRNMLTRSLFARMNIRKYQGGNSHERT